MKVQLGKQTGVALALLVTLLATLFAMGVYSVAQADGHSASRTLSATEVAPGAEITVTIALSAYGDRGSVADTLPAGFSVVSGSVNWTGGTVLDGSPIPQTDPEEVRVILRAAGTTSISYKVTAPSAAVGPLAFTGNFVNSDDESMAIGGDPSVTVAADDNGNGNGGGMVGGDSFELSPDPAVASDPVRIKLDVRGRYGGSSR